MFIMRINMVNLFGSDQIWIWIYISRLSKKWNKLVPFPVPDQGSQPTIPAHRSQPTVYLAYPVYPVYPAYTVYPILAHRSIYLVVQSIQSFHLFWIKSDQNGSNLTKFGYLAYQKNETIWSHSQFLPQVPGHGSPPMGLRQGVPAHSSYLSK